MSSSNNSLLQKKLEIEKLQKLFESNRNLFITTTEDRLTFFNFKISEIKDIKLLENYHKFLTFCNKNILDKFLVGPIEKKNENLKKTFLEKPIQTFYVENLSTEEKEFIDDNHSFYSNMIPHFFKKYQGKKKNCK